MLYLVSDASRPVRFLSAGNLNNEDQFLHSKRTIQSYELISVTRGTLHIQSGQRDYALSPGQFVLLFPGECHFGTRASQGELGFYWTHFHFDAEVSAVYEEPPEAALFPDESRPRYILPETGTLSANSRVNVLFVQLLDLAKRLGSLSSTQCSYAQSTLLLEVTHECFFRRHLMQQNEKVPLGIAEKFGYHPSYLTSVFKRYSGCTITEYLNRQRIRVAKNLLTSTPKLTLAEIGTQVGIGDEKYFMRLFKRYEGVTATAYREAFSRKPLNRQDLARPTGP